MPNVPEFIDRINNPQNYPYIDRGNGQISTHMMAHSGINEGRGIAYPMIVMLPTGELYEFKDMKTAFDHAIRTGNFKEFDTEDEAAKYAEGGYKKGTPLESKNLKEFIDSYNLGK